MFENCNLLDTFLGLTGNSITKPFDCVGTFEEVNFAISKWTLGFFTPNQTIIEIGQKVMFVAIFLEIGRCINLIVIRSMRSAGDVVFPTVLGRSKASFSLRL